MAQTSFPFENVDVTETQYSRLFRNFQDYGVNGTPEDSKLKVTAAGDSMTVDVASGQAFVRGHYYISTAAESILIASAGTDTRIDAVVLELDPVGNTILLKVVQGTAVASNPSAPALTQLDAGIYQLPLAYVTVPNGATGIDNSMIADVRTFMGQRLGIWTSTTRPTNPVANQTFGYNVTLGYHEVWKGSSWVPFAPDQPTPFLLMGA